MIINRTVSIIEKLKAMGACDGPGDAIPWVLSRPKNKRDLKSLWEDCPRADWMLWLARRCKPNPGEMVAAAWACAHLAQAYAEGSGSGASAACDAARTARTAAYDAYDAARDASYADAAALYGAAASAASAATAAFADAADAARAAYYAATAASAQVRADRAADDASSAAQKDCADMVRLLVTCPVLP